MPAESNSAAEQARRADEAFRRFLQRCWQHDVAPLLRDRQAETRRKTARSGGRWAALTGLAVDSLLHLKGRPFSRALAVLGSSAGALLPDLWDWSWLRAASVEARDFTEQQVVAAAGRLADDEALGLFGLSGDATEDDLRAAWRRIALRWHPDKAPDEAGRIEYHLRFVAYQNAHARLCEAFETQRLPRRPGS